MYEIHKTTLLAYIQRIPYTLESMHVLSINLNHILTIIPFKFFC